MRTGNGYLPCTHHAGNTWKAIVTPSVTTETDSFRIQEKCFNTNEKLGGKFESSKIILFCGHFLHLLVQQYNSEMFEYCEFNEGIRFQPMFV